MSHGNLKTDKREACLNLWDRGMTSNEIAMSVGISRSAVMGHIGRARRDGDPRAVVRRQAGGSPIRRHKKRARPSAPRKFKPSVEISNRWDADEDAKLRDLLGQGLTQAAIGRVLGRSEAGIHARKKLLGLTAPKGRKVNTIANPDPVTRSHERALERMEAEEGGKLLTEIGRHDCRYPVGPESGAKQKFCGARKACGSSYCETHKARTLGRIIPPEAMEAEFAEAA